MSKKRLISIFIAFILLFGTAGIDTGCLYSFAGIDEPTTDPEGYIKLYSPEIVDEFFIGDYMLLNYYVKDIWESYYTMPEIYIFNSSGNKVFYSKSNRICDVDTWTQYKGTLYLNPNRFVPGEYKFRIVGSPSYKDGTIYTGVDSSEVPKVNVEFTLYRLNPPTGLSLKSGKKKVTLKYKHAYGADHYEIYRSTKKNTGYKLIGTTDGKKYVDKKVKKRKRYYYMVRSVRVDYGTVYSSFSAPKRSKKVK